MSVYQSQVAGGRGDDAVDDPGEDSGGQEGGEDAARDEDEEDDRGVEVRQDGHAPIQLLGRRPDDEYCSSL